MKVLIICANGDLSGAPLHARDMALFLDTQDIDIQVIMGSPGRTYDELCKLPNIKTTLCAGLTSSKNAITILSAFLRLLKIIEVSSPDILYLHGMKPGFLGRIISLITRVPYLYTIHGLSFGPGRSMLNSVLGVVIEKLCYISCKNGGIIHISKSDSQAYNQVIGSQVKSELIYNGVRDLIHLVRDQRASQNTDTLTILVPARVAFQKDHETIFLAASKWMNPNVKIILHFAGKGTNDEAFIKVAKKVIENANVETFFHGEVSNIDHLYDITDVVLLSSRYEGLPLVLLECMSAGKLAIATDVTGNNEVINHGLNGYLFPLGDVGALISIWNKISSSDNFIMQQNARSSYEQHFSQKIMQRNTLEFLRKLVMQ